MKVERLSEIRDQWGPMRTDDNDNDNDDDSKNNSKTESENTSHLPLRPYFS